MTIKAIKEKQRFPPLFKGLPKEIPFKKDDVLKVDTINNYNYKLGKEKLIGKPLIVSECWQSDIGKMSVYLIRFKPDEGIKNPYLAHHFLFYDED